jgi:hypothetical protein
MGGMDHVLHTLNSPGLGNVVRVVILFVGFTLAMSCIKFAWVAYRAREPYRGWGLGSYGLFVITPAISGLFRFGESLNWYTTASYFGALFCGIMALRVTYTVDPHWRKVRDEDRARRSKQRSEEDTLRAGDRISQSEERADSRATYDVEHPPADTKGQEAREEFREEQDSERQHSHDLQDTERDHFRDAEDHGRE